MYCTYCYMFRVALSNYLARCHMLFMPLLALIISESKLSSPLLFPLISCTDDSTRQQIEYSTQPHTRETAKQAYIATSVDALTLIFTMLDALTLILILIFVLALGFMIVIALEGLDIALSNVNSDNEWPSEDDEQIEELRERFEASQDENRELREDNSEIIEQTEDLKTELAQLKCELAGGLEKMKSKKKRGFMKVLRRR
uniref:Uncharacterized protein n=1 Tax=Craspedostauros australis TaxID=1486917 RepID=A0A7R9WWZ7_9STRA|mmetsp:Transcript_21654/g.60283  ORF Transcript_21654/g.60283 Transcript_21654/m.60283 type:complete len:200 (+) Transcript_21654:271-870(+)